MEPILLISIFVSFFLTLFFTPLWIKNAKQVGLCGRDMHKLGESNVSESGGIIVLLGFTLGVLTYVALKTFYFKSTDNLIEIFSILVSILIIGFVGIIDDLFGWKVGLNKKTRIIFLIFAAIPLMVINAGESTMMGIEFGAIYFLFLIPLGIVATSSTFNFLAGYNGLEATQGIIVLTALAIVTWVTGSSWISLVLMIMVSCLVAFYLFNKCPAKVFPGDVMTYSMGALIGIAAILGNIEKIAVFFFIPYILEVFLKLRGRLKVESFGKLKEDGTLDLPHEKICGLEHLAILILQRIKGSAKEREVVWVINLFQIIIIGIGLFLFRSTIFG